MSAVHAEAVLPSRPDSTVADGRRTRGRLVLSDGVVEKIAGQVVSEIGAAYGTSGGFLGLGAHADASAPPKVQVSLTEDFADLEIRAGIAYPTSIRRAAEQIRHAVSDRVQELTGVTVRRVDVEIAFLHTDLAGSSTRSSSEKEIVR